MRRSHPSRVNFGVTLLDELQLHIIHIETIRRNTTSPRGDIAAKNKSHPSEDPNQVAATVSPLETRSSATITSRLTTNRLPNERCTFVGQSKFRTNDAPSEQIRPTPTHSCLAPPRRARRRHIRSTARRFPIFSRPDLTSSAAPNPPLPRPPRTYARPERPSRKLL